MSHELTNYFCLFLLLNDMLGAIRLNTEIVIVDQLIFVFAAK